METHHTSREACLVAKSYSPLCNPMDCSPPGSSLQATILELVAISSSRVSSQLRDWNCISCIGRWVLCHCTTWEVLVVTHQQTKWHTHRHHDSSKAHQKCQKVGGGPISANLHSLSRDAVQRIEQIFPKLLLSQPPSVRHLNCLQFLTNWQV